LIHPQKEMQEWLVSQTLEFLQRFCLNLGAEIETFKVANNSDQLAAYRELSEMNVTLTFIREGKPNFYLNGGPKADSDEFWSAGGGNRDG